MSRTTQKMAVKNRAPAPIQISAEQILREAHDRSGEVGRKRTDQRATIVDPEELKEYRTGRRKEYEDAIRRNRMSLGNYVKYAQWEEAQEEFERARSVWERALAVDHRKPSIWAKYAEMEMKHTFVNHARNIYDRAVALLPRVDSLWYKYTYMEEMLENFPVARTIWDRWMAWDPDEAAWMSYCRFEERRGDVSKARRVFERFLQCHPTVRTYVKFAKWEERNKQAPFARAIFERALAELSDWELTSQDLASFYTAFAAFEEHQGEIDRARAIFQYATTKTDDFEEDDHLLKLKEAYFTFEKKHGAVDAVERQIFERRRQDYEARVLATPADYDSWFDLAKLEEDALALATTTTKDEESKFDAVRDVYERAVAQVPPTQDKKQHWRRYVYLWIYYAIFEELVAKDLDRARAVYRAALDLIPCKQFAFAKLWLFAANFEVRRRDLDKARALLGEALYKCRNLAKAKLYLGYVDLERQLGELDRCRAIFSKFLRDAPSKVRGFTAFADFESSIGEYARARAIFDLGIDQPVLDKPDILWKAYLDLEISLEQRRKRRKDGLSEDDDLDDEEDEDEGRRRVADLYERLLEKTKHVKVWISYAKYEVDQDPERARRVFERADEYIKQDGSKEERVVLLEAWLAAETRLLATHPDRHHVDAVQAKMPRKIKKRRPRPDDDDAYEDYIDYVFPDDQQAPLNLKLLEAARKWKADQLAAEASNSGGAPPDPPSANGGALNNNEFTLPDDDDDPLPTAKRPRTSAADHYIPPREGGFYDDI